jgi:hypothetical protein
MCHSLGLVDKLVGILVHPDLGWILIRDWDLEVDRLPLHWVRWPVSTS